MADEITYAKPALHDAGIWPRVSHAALVARLALRCAIKGHEWRSERPTRCVRVTACRVCGHYIGSSRIGDPGSSCRWYRRPVSPEVRPATHSDVLGLDERA